MNLQWECGCECQERPEIGRIVARPGELQVGIVTALVGGPFFVVLVRRRRMAEL